MGPAFLRHAVAGSLPGFLIPRKNRQLLFIAYAHHRVALLKLPIVRSQEPNLTVRCEQAGQLNSISTSLNSWHKDISVFLQSRPRAECARKRALQPTLPQTYRQPKGS